MVLTKCGCLLLLCSVLAVCLFCCLSYASFSGTRTRRSGESQRGSDGTSPRNRVETEGVVMSG